MRIKLPLFPLPNVVLFPGMSLPLLIFEPRYRQMIKDVMASDARFGIQLCQEYNPDTMIGVPFDVGTMAEVMEYELLADGRMNIVVVGTERFRVSNYDEDAKPYLMGEIDYFSDVPDGYVTKKLQTETAHLFQEAMRLTRKVQKQEPKTLELPESPEEMSFYIAEHLRGSLVLKQDILEMGSIKARLVFERDVLSKLVKTLAARAQIEEAFGDMNCQD